MSSWTHITQGGNGLEGLVAALPRAGGRAWGTWSTELWFLRSKAGPPYISLEKVCTGIKQTKGTEKVQRWVDKKTFFFSSIAWQRRLVTNCA